jgi:tetratricopeptide (TPR) repeat protein
VWLTVSYIVVGRTEAAIPVWERLSQVDPLSIYVYQMEGDIKFYKGEIKESLPHFRWWLQKDPESPFVRYLCSVTFGLSGEMEECFKTLDSIIRDTPTLIYAKVARFLKAALKGDKDEALSYATEELKQEVAAFFGINFSIIVAWAYALIGEKDQALSWLNKSLNIGFSPYPLLSKWETFQTVLKECPSFQDYMSEVKKRCDQFKV